MADQSLTRVGHRAAELGIREYRIQHSHDDETGRVFADLLGSGGAVLGRVVLSWDARGGPELGIHWKDDAVTVRWDLVDGTLTLTDQGNLLSARKTLTREGWRGPAEDLPFWQEHFETAVVGAVVLEDYLRNSGHDRAFRPAPGWRGEALVLESPDPSGTEEIFPTDGAPRCTGITVRGDAVGSSRSLCCDAARQEANIKCWNDWCAGCCRHLECDAACGLGDYFCVCGVTGRSCGAPC